MPFTGFRRSIHRISTGWFRTAALVFALALATAAPAASQTPAALFRLFLNDGRVLTSYGEWARVGDRVVFSMPTRRGGQDLQLVTLPAAQVNWTRTDSYAAALRADIYAATRGEADFQQLGDQIAAMLNAVAGVQEPNARLARAEEARRILGDWPSTHHGYRAAEVRDILGMLDEVILDLRASTGQPGMQLALVAPPPFAPSEPLLPEPTEAEMVEQLVTAADVAVTPAERTSLLQRLLGLLDRASALLPALWAKTIRANATRTLAEEARVDRAYAELRTTTLTAAVRHTSRANVKALERLRSAVRTADTKLGQRRPDEIAALVAMLDTRVDDARRYQLARDQWELRIPGVRKYNRAVQPSLAAIDRHTPTLEDVRTQAGPPATRLDGLIERWRRDGLRLERVTPPPSLNGVHALFRSAWTMAEQAYALRLQAASANDPARAAQASSAAAGALMLLSRARADLAAALVPPPAPAQP